MSTSTTDILFGDRLLARRKHYDKIPDEFDDSSSSGSHDGDNFLQNYSHVRGVISPCVQNTVQYFFGFMFEEDNPTTGNTTMLDNDEEVENMTVDSSLESPTIWNRLNGALCTSLVLSSSATSVPVALVSAMIEFQSDSNNFVTRATAAAVWGTSMGKLLNGFVTDLVGSRRTAVFYSAMLAVALLRLALTTTPESAVWACFWTEFCASVQWPTVIVTLATHYRGHGSMYEGGIHLAALAARLGSLVGILGSSFLLNRNVHWRIVAVIGAWMALQSSAFSYLYGWDAPSERNQPQNPVDPVLWRQYLYSQHQRRHHHSTTTGLSAPTAVHWIHFLLSTVIWPSMKHVLGSSVFLVGCCRPLRCIYGQVLCEDCWYVFS